ncbi:GNAT family N-acetyltransferase [Sphingobacterium lactis]|uniref:GNAT family N-acetyltransferase n=1 Tax=Sphingobacterium lactis TaxID=797291 RepID=UPI003DA64112
MTLTTERLILEQPTAADFQRFYEIYGDPETNAFNPYGGMSYERANTIFPEILSHWNIHDFGLWKIKTKESPDRIIGFGGLSWKKYILEDRLNLGYRLDTAAWGKGFATELANNAITYGFNKLDKPEIFAIVRPANKPSIHVLEKCRFDHVGYLDDFPGLEKSLIYKLQRKT